MGCQVLCPLLPLTAAIFGQIDGSSLCARPAARQPPSALQTNRVGCVNNYRNLFTDDQSFRRSDGRMPRSSEWFDARPQQAG